VRPANTNRFDSLRGKTALVTGASSGIGQRLVEGLAAAGANVATVGRHQASLNETAPTLSPDGSVDYVALVADLQDPHAIDDAAARAWQWRSGIDIIVNAAGVIPRSSVHDTTLEQWDATFAVNARAAFLLTRALGQRMLDTQGGAVVNITSLAGNTVTGAPIAYGASKAALIYITRYLAARWAPTIRVNAVAPGYIRTRLNADWLAHIDNEQYVLNHTPLQRVGDPDDVVEAVLFLASPGASYITGQNLHIDGGWSTQ
jgi:3-oxoacyl-[acyl-carrier protein] reductase